MLTVPPSLRFVTLLAVLCTLGRGTSPAADCNQNGIDDARDVFPTGVGFDRLATNDLDVPTREVLAGDWNGDGKVDLVLLGMENQAYLVENLGNRRHGAATRLYFEETIGSIALTDLDGDLDLDLLTTNLRCNACPVGVYGQIFIHLNNGKGQFSADAPYEFDQSINGITVADLVGSPEPDVIVGMEQKEKIFIYENLGSAKLRPSVEIVAPSDPIIKVVDLDLDGQADIVASGMCRNFRDSFGYVSLVYKSDGLGNFLLQNYYLPPFCDRNFAFLDLSADGFPDFAIVGAPGSLQVQINDGTGRFMKPIDPLPMPGSNFGVSLGDFDRNGSTELVVAHGEAITIVHDRKMGKFELGKTYLVPWLEKGAVAVADLDNDGWLDLTANRGEAGIRILHGKEGGEFEGAGSGSLAYTENPNYIIQDFNSDGRKDLLLWSYESSASVYLNQGDGTISDRIPIETMNYPNTAEVGDFDADGNVDVALRNHFCYSCAKETESVVAFYYGDGTGNFTLGFEAPAEARGGLMKVGDMDGDGRLDLLSSFLGVNFEFFWNDGGRSFTLFPAEEPIQSLDGYPFDMFDMNSDALPDLAYYEPDWGLAVRLNEGRRKFGPPILEHSFFEDRDRVHYLPFHYPGFTMDLNGDSLPDLVRYGFRKKITVGLSDGDGTFSRSSMDLGAGDHSVEVVGMDFEGDGDIDLVVSRDCYPTCNPGVAASEITVFENNGRGGFTRLKTFSFGMSICHIRADDYDGDGRQDLLVADGYYLNQLLLNRGNGTLELVPPSEAPQRLRFRVTSDIEYAELMTFAQPAIDLDEDGDLDLVLIGGDVVSTLINHTTPAASRDANRDQIPDECQGRFFHRGDANTDTRLNIADAVFIAHHLFRGGAASTCAETEDADNNGKVNISDAILILSHLFKGGLPPAAPGPVGEACGLDPDPDGTAGALGCTLYPGC